jgi:hypothetical protein
VTEDAEQDAQHASDAASVSDELEQLSKGFQEAVSKLSAFVAE